MAKKRLNPNVVGFLTAGGIFLAVLVVAIAAFNASRRDPEAVAERARMAAKNGDYERAVALFKSAYHIDNDAKYLIEAAMVERSRANLPAMFGLLNLAHTQAPNDADVLLALLERNWEVRSYPIVQWSRVREYAESLLALPGYENNALALALRADALERLKNNDPSLEPEAAEAITAIEKVGASDRYCAMVLADHAIRSAYEQAREAQAAGNALDRDSILDEGRRKQVEILSEAVQANPDVVELRVALAEALQGLKEWDQARKVIEEGLAKHADSADLHLALANLLLAQTRDGWEQADEQQVSAWVQEGVHHAEAAAKLEPAAYRAYACKADLLRYGLMKDGSWERDQLACVSKVLEPVAKALDETAGLQTLRAAMNTGERLMLIGRGFDLALNLFRSANEEQVRKEAITYMERFVQEAESSFPERSLTALMQGHLALAKREQRPAIRAFRKAISQVEKGMGMPQFARLAREELVKIYRDANKLGLCQQYIQELVNYYQSVGQPVPLWIHLTQAEIYVRLNRTQEALDLVETLAAAYPDDPRLRTMRARILALADRGQEAEKLLGEATSDDPTMLLNQARVAAYNKNYEECLRLLDKVLEKQPDDVAALRLSISVLMASGRKDEALSFARKHMEQVSDPQIKRVLQSYEVMLTEPDPVKQEKKLLDIIASIPDEFDREVEYFNYWLSRNDVSKALPHLDKMEQLHPDEVRIKELQFELSLREKQCERARQYAAKLADLNADDAGGATYQGAYELYCGDPHKGLEQYRLAEREFPNDPEIQVRIAQCLLKIQPPKLDEAIRSLEKAAKFDPRNFLAHRLLYMLYEQKGQHAQAIPHLRAAADINPNDPFIQQRKQILDEEENPEAGIARREEYRQEHPDDIDNLLRLAELYQRINDAEHTHECLQAVAKLDPANKRMARMAARFYARIADRETGESLLKQYIETQQGLDNIIAREVLAHFYEDLGDTQAALAAFKDARSKVDELFEAGSPDARRATALAAYELAEFYRRHRDYQAMVDSYREVLANLEPENVTSIKAAKRAIIRALLTLQRFGEAAKEVEEYRQSYPNDPEGMLVQAELLMSRPDHDLEQARALLTRVIEGDPRNAWAYYLRARINTQLHQYPDARDDFLRAKALEPESFNLRHRLDLAHLYELMGQVALAEAELRELLDIKRPDRTVELRLIDLLRRTNQLEKAQAFVNELIAKEPDEPFWHYQLGRLLMEREQYSAAADQFRQVIQLSTSAGRRGAPPTVYTSLLECLTRGKRAEEALRIYDAIPPEVVTPAIQLEGARACLAAGRRDAARALIEQAVVAASQRSGTELRAVVAAAAKEDFLGRKATMDLLRDLLNNPAAEAGKLSIENTLAWYLVSDADTSLAREGLEHAEAVLKVTKPGDPEHVAALLVKARALETGNATPDEVIAAYEKVLKIAPDNIQALNNLAYRLADQYGRPAEALPYAERLLELGAARNANLLDTIAWVYFKNDRKEEALTTLQDALQLEPGNVAVLYHLGEVYRALGRRGEAQDTFRRLRDAAQAAGNEEYLRKAEEALGQL